jgi:hypothetical protein
LGSSGTMTCPVLPYFCLLCVRKDGTRAPEGPYWARKCRKGKCAGWERVRFIAGLRVPLCCPFPSPVHTVLRCVPGERGLAFPGCLAHADTGSSSKVSAPSCCPPPPAAAYSWGCRSSGLLRKWGLPETSCRGEASVCAEVTCASFPFCEGTAASSRNGDLLAFVQSLLLRGPTGREGTFHLPPTQAQFPGPASEQPFEAALPGVWASGNHRGPSATQLHWDAESWGLGLVGIGWQGGPLWWAQHRTAASEGSTDKD